MQGAKNIENFKQGTYNEKKSDIAHALTALFIYTAEQVLAYLLIADLVSGASKFYPFPASGDELYIAIQCRILQL